MKTSDILKVIDNTINPKKTLEESYVSRPKQYDLNTEMLLTKTKESHLDLYHKYTETLNDVSARLDTVSRTEKGIGSDFRSLKINEQYLLNSVYLHELYFANISDPYSEIGLDSLSYMRFSRDFGTFDEYQADLVACGMSVSSGWIATGINTYLKRYVNVIIDDHASNVPVGFIPVLVIDMWEHARRDYLNSKKDYLFSMLKEINWQIVEERIKKTDLILSVMQ